MNYTRLPKRTFSRDESFMMITNEDSCFHSTKLCPTIRMECDVIAYFVIDQLKCIHYCHQKSTVETLACTYGYLIILKSGTKFNLAPVCMLINVILLWIILHLHICLELDKKAPC